MMKEYLDTKTSKMKHKEEMLHRIALDEKDRKRLRSTLAGLIHPLDKSQLEQHRACELYIHGDRVLRVRLHYLPSC